MAVHNSLEGLVFCHQQQETAGNLQQLGCLTTMPFGLLQGLTDIQPEELKDAYLKMEL